MSKLKLFLTVLTLSAINVYGQSGSWRGELNLGQVKLPLIFNFTENVSGEKQCTLDSPSQGAKGISTELILCTTDSLSLTCNAIGASYTGKRCLSRYVARGLIHS